MSGNGVRLIDIVNLCKCEVSITVDFHTGSYLTLDQGLKELRENHDTVDIPEYVMKEMRDYGHIVHVQAYPNTPIGSLSTWGGTDERALDRMYQLLTEEEDDG